MRISIITPAFNSADTIRDTLRSVTQQTYSDIEHIIVDGESMDDTCAIVTTMAPEALWISEPDGGLYDAMNKGIRQATGDIIGILNSDDFYPHKKVIENVIRRFETERADTLYGDIAYVDKRNINRIVRTWKAGNFKREWFKLGWMPPHPAFFARSDAYERYGVFRTELRTSADYELMLRFLYKHRVSAAYIPECLVHMRTGGQSNASFYHRLRANREDRLAWQMNGLSAPFYTTLLKPLRKISQFVHL